MDAVVRRAIEEGVAPVDAIRMATLNPARHFGLDAEGVGSLSPGSAADVVVLDDLESVAVSTVLSGGEVVYADHDGDGRGGAREALVEPRSHDYPDRFYDSAAVSADPDRFRVPASVAGPDGEVRAIERGRGLLSGETTVAPPVAGGELVADPDADVLKAALLDRHPGRERGGDGGARNGERGFTGFLTGFGLDSGAVATTVVWETTAVLAVGADDDAMAAAVERVADLGGGWAVVESGSETASRDPPEVLAELPAPVAGVCADAPVEDVAAGMDAVEDALGRLGASGDRPLLALQTLAFPGVPALKLTVSGYADVLDRELVGLTPV